MSDAPWKCKACFHENDGMDEYPCRRCSNGDRWSPKTGTDLEAARQLREENTALRARITELTQGDPSWYDMSVSDAFRMWKADREELAALRAEKEITDAELLVKCKDCNRHDIFEALVEAQSALSRCRALQTTLPSTEPAMLICSHAGHEKCYKFCGHLKPHERKEDYCNESRCRHIGEFVHCVPCTLKEPKKCLICGRKLDEAGIPESEDCGGDCLECMATVAEDPQAIERCRTSRRENFLTGRQKRDKI